jgi:hypothetical protein
LSNHKYYHLITSYSQSPFYNKGEHHQLGVFIGISFANPHFYGRRLKSLLQHSSFHYPKVTIVTPGYIYRHCFTNIDPLPDSHLLQLALIYENRFIKEQLDPLHNTIDRDKITIKRWGDCVKEIAYLEEEDLIRKYYANNLSFKNEIDTFAAEFAKRSAPQVSTNPHHTAQYEDFQKRLYQSCVEFLLEELIFLAYMAKTGNPLCLYPGYFLNSITFDMHKNKLYTDAPEYLQRVIYGCIEFKRLSHKADYELALS